MITLECISLSTGQPLTISEANILCLGNFDGVHLGHRALLRRARELQNQSYPHAACGVFCFRSLPSDYFMSEPTLHLSTLEQKLNCFAEEGMEFVILASFEELRDLSPEGFLDMLRRDCHCVAAVCGFNYHYGKDGKGTALTLQKALGLSAVVVDAVKAEGDTVSSSRIRTLLSMGEVEAAARLLTHPYAWRAPVEHGKALGRRLGAPTINQHFPAHMQTLRHGVYVTACTVDGVTYRGVSNVGIRPTVDADATVNCETYLLDFSGSLYGKTVEIAFLSFLRPEQKFESIDALREQIARDVEAARDY